MRRPRSRRRTIVAIVSVLIGVAPVIPVAAAGPPRMVVNIRPGEGSDPDGFVEAGGLVYFAAIDPAHGREMWRTDGTPEGTSLVADIHPGPADSDPTMPMAFRDGVLFSAYDDQGTAIWRAGADIDGAVPVTRGDVWPLAISGGRILATQNVSSGRQRLVEVDPDSGGVRAVGDLGAGAHAILHSFDLDGTLFFTVDRRRQARTELWATDGTDEGTRSLGRIGTSGEALTDYWPIEWMNQFTAFRSKVWFVRHWSDGAGCEAGGDLWVSDGTRRGTRRAAEVLGRIGPCIGDVTTVGDQLHLTSYGRGFGTAETWVTDGTRTGTSRLATYRAYLPEQAAVLGDSLLFALTQTEDEPPDLWAIDGSSDDTRLIGPLEDEPFDGLQPDAGERAYFVRGDQLWVTDGTAVGTGRLVDLQPDTDGPDIRSLTRLGSAIVFAADDGSTGSEPWVSDGTAVGTRMLRDINKVDEGSAPTGLTPTDVSLFLAALDGARASTDPRMWEIARSYAAEGDSAWMVYREAVAPAWLTVFGRDLVFAAQGERGGHGMELWAVDEGGSAHEVTEIRPGRRGSSPSDLVVMGRRVYFAATSSTGRDLWATDGTATGTVLVRDLAPGKLGAPRDLVVAGDRLFFTSGDPTHGRELWTSDGTAQGTRRVADIRPGARGSGIAELTAVGTAVYFQADDGVHGTELWASDGTRAGTRLVRDLRLSGGSEPVELTAVSDALYFVADDGAAGSRSRLWSTDGTAEGTVVARAPAGCEATGMGDPSGLTDDRGTLFFVATCDQGRELLRAEPATAVVAVADGNPSGDPDPVILGSVFGRLYFSADDAVHGRELWSTDGTPEGTTLVGDINPDGSSDPMDVVPFQRAV
jgi:ELWxxDGT repeat protein